MQYLYPLKNLLNVNLKFLTLFISFIILGLIVLKPTATFAQSPTITNFSPTTVLVVTLVSLTGTNLSNPAAITIGGVSASYLVIMEVLW